MVWWGLWGLDAQLVGNGHDHFEDGHEGRDLAEVAAADHLGVDLQASLVILARHAAADLMQAVQDVLRELWDQQRNYVTHIQGYKGGWGNICLITFRIQVNWPFKVLEWRLWVENATKHKNLSFNFWVQEKLWVQIVGPFLPHILATALLSLTHDLNNIFMQFLFFWPNYDDNNLVY